MKIPISRFFAASMASMCLVDGARPTRCVAANEVTVQIHIIKSIRLNAFTMVSVITCVLNPKRIFPFSSCSSTLPYCLISENEVDVLLLVDTVE